MFGTQFPADSLRQLIHELRTPLNAIIGFAEMIEGQYMGPAAAGYRGSAAEIMAQARGLLGAVDDLDTAARLETRRLRGRGEPGRRGRLAVPAARKPTSGSPRSAARRSRSRSPRGCRRALVEPGAAERMFARLLAGTIGLAGEGETIRAAMTLEPRGEAAMLRLAVDRPAAIAGRRRRPTCSIPATAPTATGPARPALGLGFALRLVRNLAEAVGGALVVDAARFALYLPARRRPAAAAPDESAGRG